MALILAASFKIVHTVLDPLTYYRSTLKVTVSTDFCVEYYKQRAIERLQAEGKAQNSEGHVSEIASKVEGYAQGLSNQIKGALSGVMNSATGNSAGEAEGNIQETAGKVQKEFNS